MSAPAANRLTQDQDLVTQVQNAFRQADAAGSRRPGRDAIQARFGVTEHQARKAIAAAEALLDQETPDTTPTEWPDRLPRRPRARVLEMPDRGEPTAELPKLGFTDPKEIAELEALLQSGPSDPTPVTRRKPAPFPRAFPLFFIGLAGALTVWSGWVQLGHLTGFGVVQLLPGIWDSFTIDAAILLPLGIEFYGGYAIRVWLSAAQLSSRTVTFAKISSLASLVIGAGAQVATHLLVAAGQTHAPWWITTAVACIPVVLVGLSAGLARLVSNDRDASGAPDQPGVFARLWARWTR